MKEKSLVCYSINKCVIIDIILYKNYSLWYILWLNIKCKDSYVVLNIMIYLIVFFLKKKIVMICCYKILLLSEIIWNYDMWYKRIYFVKYDMMILCKIIFYFILWNEIVLYDIVLYYKI